MFKSIEDSIRRDNAVFARDLEYVKESISEDMIDDRLEVAENKFMGYESSDEIQEALNMVNKLSDEENVIEESAEIERILSSNEDITFDEMIGIS